VRRTPAPVTHPHTQEGKPMTELSTDEQAIVDRFDAAPVLPESWEGSNALADHFENGFESEQREAAIVEEVARAIQANKETFPPAWETLSEQTQGMYRRLAVAAVAAYRATQDGGAEA
jgi:hypothetical protein